MEVATVWVETFIIKKTKQQVKFGITMTLKMTSFDAHRQLRRSIMMILYDNSLLRFHSWNGQKTTDSVITLQHLHHTRILACHEIVSAISSFAVTYTCLTAVWLLLVFQYSWSQTGEMKMKKIKTSKKKSHLVNAFQKNKHDASSLKYVCFTPLLSNLLSACFASSSAEATSEFFSLWDEHIWAVWGPSPAGWGPTRKDS